MSRSLEQGRLLRHAHAMALRAKCGLLRLPEAEALSETALRVMPEGCPVRQAAVEFLTSARTHGRQPAPLAVAGAGLEMAVIRALWPDQSTRSDLNG